jgi:DNA primase
MARIRQDDVDTVRERTDIVQLVSQYVSLKKAGADRHAGLCPFHTEKTPSFGVSPSKQVFHCFGCGAGGNAFHFLERIENVTFTEAVERLAKQAGITLRYEGVSSGERRAMSRKQVLFRANARAAELYHRMLLEGREGADARAYLQERGITKDSVEEFGIGYAPGYPDFLLRRMSRDFSPEILVEAGLALKDQRGGIRDRFRGRVVFPLHDLSGQAVGFGGRLLQSQPADGSGPTLPKYVNSPETPVYRKGELLYNLNRAKTEVSRSGTAYLVEGYTDVIALHQAGEPTGLATCGTALGEGHFGLLRRFARRAVLAFDSDEAGARAAERAYAFHERYPVEALVLVLPEGLDPADLVKERGPEAFRQAAEAAIPLVEYMIRRATRGVDTGDAEERARGVQAGLPIVAGLANEVRRQEYAALLADLMGVSTESVLFELQRTRPPQQPGVAVPAPEARPGQPRSPTREVEKEALKLVAQRPDISLEYLDGVEEDRFTTERYRKALALLREPGTSSSASAERAAELGLAELMAEITMEPLKGEATSHYAQQVFSRLEELSLGRRIDTMKKRLERLNPTRDPQSYDSLFEELIALEGRRRRVRARAGEGA